MHIRAHSTVREHILLQQNTFYCKEERARRVAMHISAHVCWNGW